MSLCHLSGLLCTESDVLVSGEKTPQHGELYVLVQVLNMKTSPLPFVSCSTPEQEMEERKCNYERYRGLVQNDFASSECCKLYFY